MKEKLKASWNLFTKDYRLNGKLFAIGLASLAVFLILGGLLLLFPAAEGIIPFLVASFLASIVSFLSSPLPRKG